MEKIETLLVTFFAIALLYFMTGAFLALANPAHQILIWGFSK